MNPKATSEAAKKAVLKAWNDYAPNRGPFWGRVVAEDRAFYIAEKATQFAIDEAVNEAKQLKDVLQRLIHAVNIHLLCGRPEIKTVDDVINGLRIVAEKLDKVSRVTNEAARVEPNDELLFEASELIEKYVHCDCKWDGGHHQNCATVKAHDWRTRAHNASCSSPTWIKTADRPPTKEDGDSLWNVWAIEYGAKYPELRDYREVNSRYQWWMPIPPVPEVDSTPVVSGENQNPSASATTPTPQSNPLSEETDHAL